MFCRFQDRKQQAPRDAFRVWISSRENVRVKNDPHVRLSVGDVLRLKSELVEGAPHLREPDGDREP